MKIVHFAPFAPCGCGLYEAARDMVTADREAGHISELVDVGSTIRGGNYTPGEPGKVDNRGFAKIVSADPQEARNADILIAHTGTPDPWFSVCQSPLIWVLHGRPQACFQPEQFGQGNSYSLMAEIASWPRVKVLLSFWPFHEKYWRAIVPNGKLVCLEAPPVDHSRFNPVGPTHDFGALGGKYNVVLADSWREDVDLFEITNGCLEYARAHHGVKFHFYGCDTPLPKCWEILFNGLKDLGAMGEIWARRPNLDEVYRAADLVISPHRITTRVIAEALCCDTPVMAARGCEYANWTCNPEEPGDVATMLEKALGELNQVKDQVKEIARNFALETYNQGMKTVYEKVLN